jgi:high affinity Mn2+ porin
VVFSHWGLNRLMRFLIFVISALPLVAQGGNGSWYDIHGQATTITDTHGPFHSPYEGQNSLRPIRETDTSLTMTIFATFRYRNTELGFSGEVAGGTGFSGVAGIAGFPNGEIARVGKPTPTPYVARLYLKQKVSRFTWVLGKVAATDFFDDNVYSHDPRTQFENWSIMDNGAWDYPADARGYTVGAVQEVELGRSVLRVGSFLEPVTANGPKLDGHFTMNRGDTFEWQYGYMAGGTVRVLGFVNHANMGKYREAVQDIVATRKSGRIKYGFGVNVEQKITSTVGAFARLGWNDGKTESWAFTEIDRTASGGASVKGTGWHRPDDVLGAAIAVNGISGDHRAYLARGGYGFIIGDGQLPHPGPETVFETYYAWRVRTFLTLSPDYQFIANPAYNRDRGPVHVLSLRVHVER